MPDKTKQPEAQKPERIFFRIERATGKTEKVVVHGAAGIPGQEGYIPELTKTVPVMKTQEECTEEAEARIAKEGYAKLSVQQAFDDYFEFMGYN